MKNLLVGHHIRKWLKILKNLILYSYVYLEIRWGPHLKVTVKFVDYEVPINGGTFKMISLNIIGLWRKGSL